MTQVEIGTLTEEELSAFNGTRSTANNLLHQLGMLEVQKTRLISQVESNEAQAQSILNGARERLGIEDNTPWRVQSDGKVFTDSTEESSEEEATTEG